VFVFLVTSSRCVELTSAGVRVVSPAAERSLVV